MRFPVTALACFVAIKLLFNQYTATATILFDPRNARVTTTQEVLPDLGPDSIAVESLVQVAKSDGFLSALIARLRLTDDAEFIGSATFAGRSRLGGARQIARPARHRPPRRNLRRRRVGEDRHDAQRARASPTPPPT